MISSIMNSVNQGVAQLLIFLMCIVLIEFAYLMVQARAAFAYRKRSSIYSGNHSLHEEVGVQKQLPVQLIRSIWLK